MEGRCKRKEQKKGIGCREGKGEGVVSNGGKLKGKKSEDITRERELVPDLPPRQEG